MKKRRYKLSQLATIDFFEILDYTIEKWGIEQAISYKLALENELVNLGHFPYKGISRPYISKDIRSIIFQTHIIFYKIDSDFVIIYRIIHQSQDVSAEHIYDYFFGDIKNI